MHATRAALQTLPPPPAPLQPHAQRVARARDRRVGRGLLLTHTHNPPPQFRPPCSPTPNAWRLREIFVSGIAYGLYLTASTWTLFHLASQV